jgi:hypothetical protein
MTDLGTQSIAADRDYILGPVPGADGAAATFSGVEPVTATLWRPDGPSAAMPAAWADAAAGTVRVSVPAASLAGFVPGSYTLDAHVVAGGLVLEAPPATLELRGGPQDPPAASAVLTVAIVEERLLRRTRGLAGLAQYDATTVGTANPDVAPAIVDTLLELGYAPASLVAPADADLAAIPPAVYPRFLALARIKWLTAILDGILDLYEIQVGINRFAMGEAARNLRATLERLQAEYVDVYEAGSSRSETACVESTYVAPRPASTWWDGGGG